MHVFMRILALSMPLQLVVPAVASADLGVPEFEAVYKVRVSVARGEMRLVFERRDGALVYHSELEPTGFVSLFKRGVLAETSRFEYGGGQVRPLEYDLVDTISENRDAHYVFDWAAGEVTGSYRGQPVETGLDGLTVDRLLLQVAIMSDLAHGREVEAYTVFDRAKAKHYSIEVGDAGTAETPAGEFSVVEVSYTSDDGRKAIVLQCAPDLHYLPVRIEQREDGEVKSRAELVEYEFGSAAG
ncbi:MAG: DUF3108 domain-containing protein [Gammaproteobacteria bacterium]|nr:DUF3108 domain-containing protein [Gammaproteobacteria bacterium]